MKRLTKRQEKEFIAIIDAIKAYADKYGENYLSFGYSDGHISANNDPYNQKLHYDYVLFEDGALIFDICDKHEYIRKGRRAV